MSNLITILLALPPVLLCGTILVPNRMAASFVRGFRGVVTSLAAIEFAIAAALAISHALGILPVIHATWSPTVIESPVAATVYYDGVSSLMLALVSFVGWVICQYSVSYLDGEVTQGRYFRWTGFTIGAVSLMVISGNLLMFIVAWVMTSAGLHQLLMHYGHRPAARRAAWTKFTISRLGDAALVGAMAILYHEFKTLDFAEMFSAARSISDVTPATNVAGFLLVLGAVTKSAQFPFHTWLPNTMETPTPVSALMHAGIVNAGGYLIVRMSSLVSLTPHAMLLLAVIGTVTACFGAIVMMTQTSVKKSLAYSTIAQMGFMMLQCGLGAFSAAMLHILAHSLYKAHAFLSSGSVMTDRAGTDITTETSIDLPWAKLAIVGILNVAFLASALFIFGIDPITKPGGLLLGGVLCLALTQWIGQAIKSGNKTLLIRSVFVSGALCVTYVASYFAVDSVISESIPKTSSITMSLPVTVIMFVGFGGMFMLLQILYRVECPAWMNRLYVHVANGFYVEPYIRRFVGNLAKD